MQSSGSSVTVEPELCVLFEDHREALFFWERLEVRGACCLHIDAHLDMSETRVPFLGTAERPEVNCGNYLLPALSQGLVGQLIWVVPPHLHPKGLDAAWALEELARWVSLRTSEAASLTMRAGRLEGTLCGFPFTLCHADNLPPLEVPVLLDLDVDYFFDRRDAVWQTPFSLFEHLRSLQIQAVTIAFSVEGGYTPVQRRYLGHLSQLLALGQDQRAWELWRQLQGLETARGDLPAWVRATELVTRALGCGLDYQSAPFQEAARLDPGFQVRAQDLVHYYWQRDDFEKSFEWLDRVEAEGVDYLRGLVAHTQGNQALAVRSWKRCLEYYPQLEEAHQGHLWHLCGLARLRQKKAEEAVADLREAVSRLPREATPWHDLGRAQAASGHWEEASRSLRKAIRLAPEQLLSLQCRLELAEVYLKTGELAWTQAECRRILQSQAPGKLKLKAEQLLMRVAIEKKYLPSGDRP